MNLTDFRELRVIPKEIRDFLTQRIDVRRIQDYRIVERIFKSSHQSDSTKSELKDMLIEANLNSKVENSFTFLFNIFDEGLTFQFGNEYSKGIDTEFFKSIKVLSELVEIPFLNRLQERFYQKYITPRFKKYTRGVDSFSVTIPVILPDVVSGIKSFQNILNVQLKPIFGNILKVTTNDIILSISFFKGRIRLNLFMISSFEVDFEDQQIDVSGKLKKQSIKLECKQLYLDIPHVSESSTDSLKFLNSSNYVF